MPAIPAIAPFTWLSESMRKFADVTISSPSLRPSRISTPSPARAPIFTVRHASRGPGEILVKPVEAFCEVVQPLIPRE